MVGGQLLAVGGKPLSLSTSLSFPLAFPSISGGAYRGDPVVNGPPHFGWAEGSCVWGRRRLDREKHPINPAPKSPAYNLTRFFVVLPEVSEDLSEEGGEGIRSGGGEGGGSGTPKIEHQKWPNQSFPMVNFVFSHDGHFGRGGGGVQGLFWESLGVWDSVTPPPLINEACGACTASIPLSAQPARPNAPAA